MGGTHRLASVGGDPSDQRLQPLGTPCAEHEPGATLRQMPRGGFADAAAGAGDRDYLAGNSRHNFPQSPLQ